MLYSAREYEASLIQLAEFKNAVAKAEKRTADKPWFHDIEISGMKSLIADLEADTLHYALLKSGETVPKKACSLESLPTTLIETRIASGLSQSDLAEQLGWTRRDVQRLEDSGYKQADQESIIRVAILLRIEIDGLQ